MLLLRVLSWSLLQTGVSVGLELLRLHGANADPHTPSGEPSQRLDVYMHLFNVCFGGLYTRDPWLVVYSISGWTFPFN